jgi:hypothetical protein
MMSQTQNQLSEDVVIHVDVTLRICTNTATLTSLGEFHIINFLELFSITPPLEIT